MAIMRLALTEKEDEMTLRMPPGSEAKIEELYHICEENPEYIPLPVVAKFMGANAEGLRYSIEQGKCKFGISWQKTARGNKAFKIPTPTFWLWYTQGHGYKNDVGQA